MKTWWTFILILACTGAEAQSTLDLRTVVPGDRFGPWKVTHMDLSLPGDLGEYEGTVKLLRQGSQALEITLAPTEPQAPGELFFLVSQKQAQVPLVKAPNNLNLIQGKLLCLGQFSHAEDEKTLRAGILGDRWTVQVETLELRFDPLSRFHILKITKIQ